MINLARLLLVLALALTIGLLDATSTPRIGWGFLYLGPVVASSYFFGWYGGIFMMTICLAAYHWVGLPKHMAMWSFHPGNTWLEFAAMLAACVFTSRIVKINADLQQAGKELEANLQQKESIFQSVAGGLLLLDSRLTLVDMNPVAEKLLGITLKESRGHTIHLAPLLDFEAQKFFRTLAQDEKGSHEGRFAVRKPEPRSLEFTAAPIPGDASTVAGWAVAIQDLTDLVKAHEVLLSKAHTLAVQDTRNRMARDLHDNLAQTLASIHMRLSGLREVSSPKETLHVAQWDKVEEILVRILKETRQNIWELRPTALEHMDFVSALRSYLDEMETMGTLQGHLEAEGRLQLDSDREVLLFYVIQEALMNVQKHARARNVRVVVKATSEEIRVHISDDGEGFDSESKRMQPLRKSYGLTTMQERVGLLGGRFTLDSARGKGTTISVVVPVDGELRETLEAEELLSP